MKKSPKTPVRTPEDLARIAKEKEELDKAIEKAKEKARKKLKAYEKKTGKPFKSFLQEIEENQKREGYEIIVL